MIVDAATRAILAGPSVIDAWVDLLDQDDREIGRLPTVTSCQVTANRSAPIRVGVDLRLDGPVDLDWVTRLARPMIHVHGVDPWPLGVFLLDAPRQSVTEYGWSWDISGLDRTKLLDGYGLMEALSLDPGTNALAAAVTFIRDVVGIAQVAATPSDETLRTAMAWPVGTSALAVVNKIMDAINYTAAWADRSGMIRLEPYRRPQDRPESWVTRRGPESMHAPVWTRETSSDVPNVAIVTTPGSDEEPGLVGIAQNLNPDSPWSVPNRGYNARRYDVDEVTSQGVIDALAARYLVEASSPSSSISATHAPAPIDLADMMRLEDVGLEVLTVVEEWAAGWDTTSVADVSLRLREVVDV